MEIEKRTENNVEVLQVSGAIDFSSSRLLEDLVKSTIAGGRTYMVLDLTEASDVDSLGVASIIKSHSALRKSGGDLKLAAVPADIVFILRQAGAGALIAMFPTVDAAIRDFQ
ncbi:MAG: STAS domain-containing protein [Leptospirales bacterium]|nr:STAS domain-containing protein [Leptospirales bacterium]